MSSPPKALVPRRPLPGRDSGVSRLGFTIESAPRRSVVERIRRARSHGVTLFDAAGAADPPHAGAALAEALPDGDACVTVIVPYDAPAVRAEARDSAHTNDRDAHSPPDWARRFNRIVERLAPITGNDPGRLGAPESAGGDSWVLATRVDPASGRLPPGGPSAVLLGSMSLLDIRCARLLEAEGRGSPPSLLARDPFAGGRLDGSRLTEGWLGRGPSSSPASLRSLTQEFEPVLRLGFLTEGHARTLAQAAIQFVDQQPSVLSVVAPLPPIERLDELVGAFGRPALTGEEMRRAEHLAEGLGPGSRALPLK